MATASALSRDALPPRIVTLSTNNLLPAVDARRQQQHGKTARLLDSGAKTVVGRAAFVQHLGKERG